MTSNLFCKKNVYYVGCMCSFFACLILLVAPVLTYLGYLRISRLLFFSGLVLCLASNVLFVCVQKLLTQKIIKQMFVVYAVIILFFCSALSNSYIRNNTLSKLLIPEILVFGTGLIFWMIKVRWKSVLNFIIKSISNNKIFFICIVFICILSLECINTFNTWDSYNYYLPITNVKNLVFSPNDVVLFKNCGHASYSYMFFVGIFEFIFPNTGAGARILNIFLHLISTILVLLILKKMFPEMKYIIKLGLTLMYAVTPALYGPLYDISPEYLLLFFTISFLYCHIQKYYILQFLSLVCLAFTKETGVIIVGGFFVGFLIDKSIYFIKQKNFKLVFEKKFIIEFLVLYIPCLLFLLYYVVDSSGWGGNVSSGTGNEEYMNCFGFNMTYIIGKLKQMYLSNFQWIITIAIMCSLVLSMLKNKKDKKKRYDEIVCMMLFSYIFFVLMQLFYVTYAFPRYILPHYFFQIIFLALTINNFGNISFLGKVLIPIVCIFWAQNYVTYDPITKALFNDVNIGKANVYPANVIAAVDLNSKIVSKDAINQFNISEYTMYNRQYLYKNELLNEIFDSIEYTSKDMILIPDYCPPRTVFTFWSGTVYYDKEQQSIIQLSSFQEKKDSIQKINYQLVNEESNIDISMYDRVFVLEFPYWENDLAKNILSQYVEISAVHVEYKMWSAEVYQIK